MNKKPSGPDLDQTSRRTLQTRVGLAVAIGSVFTVGLWMSHLLLVRRVEPAVLLAEPGIWLTLLWVPICVWTAYDRSGYGKLFQVAIVYLVALLNAGTAAPGELTALLFLGIATGLATAYGLLADNKWYWLIPGVLFAGIAGTRQLTAREFQLLPLANWFTAAFMILFILYALIRTALHYQKNQQGALENIIDEQTKDLRQSLDQSEELRNRNQVLLRELHHRTRNNLQLVASLLSLQRMSAESGNIDTEDVLDTAERRVRAMANIQELLHRSDRESEVPIDDFLNRLTDEFTQTGQVSNVHVTTDNTAHVKVALDFAVPCGLVVNELITNSIKHGYNLQTDRPIWIRIHESDGRLTITVEDTGKGVPKHVSLKNPATTGLRIVTGLVQQLNGSIELTRTPNTKWTVEVPLPSQS